MSKKETEVKIKEAPISKELVDVTDKINKDFGAGSIMHLSDKPQNIKSIPTGSLGLDIAMGVGGHPRGRIVEIYGPESSGKTTLAIHAIAEAQKQGGNCVMIDMEHAFDSAYAEKLGVDIKKLYISQPDYGDQALEIADRLISSGKVALIVIDSVAALVPKGELEGEMGEAKMGLHARLMSQALRKMIPAISKNDVCVIFINQLRDKIGVMYGSPETTTGGNALKFYASVRLDIRRKAQIKDGDVAIGNKITVRVIKNKVAPPFRIAEFDINYGLGVDKMGEIVDIGSDLGIITKAGSWYSYNGDKIGQGRDAVINFLKDNVGLAEVIENQIKAQING